MFLELNNKDSEMLAVGKLVRGGREIAFSYETLQDGRRVTREDPMDGFINLRANVSIRTHDDLGFVFGDNILLDGYDKTMKVINLTKRVNERQLMFLNESNQVEYILDLVG